MMRTASRAVYQHCRRGAAAAPPFTARRFSAEGGDRLVELSTKDDYVNFPRSVLSSLEVLRGAGCWRGKVQDDCMEESSG